MIVNIELKTGIWFYAGIEDWVVKEVQNMNMGEQVWYSSFNHASVMRVKQIDSSAKIGFLYMDGILQPEKYV